MKKLFAALALATTTLAAGSADASWAVSTIDTAGSFELGEHCSIGLGHNWLGVEQLHVVYQKWNAAWNADMIYYATKTGTGPWSTRSPSSRRRRAPRPGDARASPRGRSLWGDRGSFWEAAWEACEARPTVGRLPLA